MPATTDMPAPAEVERTRWGAVVAVALGIVLVALDMTVIAVALPELGASFGVTPATTQWVVLVYMLPLVALSIPTGRWLDTAGPLPAFLFAVGGFGVTSVLIAAAPTMPAVLAGRGLQGFFGALIGVIGMPVVAAAVRPEHRARAMSIVLTLIPLAGVVGPALGGVLADAYGWRSVFLINVPVVLAAAWFARNTIPARTGHKAGLPLPSARMLREVLVLGVAAATLFFGIDRLAELTSGRFWLPVSLIAGSALTAWAWTRLPGSRDVISLLGRRALAMPMIALPMTTAAVGGLNFLVPYLLADSTDVTPKGIGLVLLTLAAGMAVFSPIAGVIADRFGTRPVTTAGAVVVIAGLVSLLTIDADSGPWQLAWRLALVGIGNGLFAGPNSAAILAASPAALTSTASGISSLLRTLGFALGPAFGALAWTATGGGVTGFTTGVAILAAAAAVALVTTRAAPR